jgi:hypothetical protein
MTMRTVYPRAPRSKTSRARAGKHALYIYKFTTDHCLLLYNVTLCTQNGQRTRNVRAPAAWAGRPRHGEQCAVARRCVYSAVLKPWSAKRATDAHPGTWVLSLGSRSEPVRRGHVRGFVNLSDDAMCARQLSTPLNRRCTQRASGMPCTCTTHLQRNAISTREVAHTETTTAAAPSRVASRQGEGSTAPRVAQCEGCESGSHHGSQRSWSLSSALVEEQPPPVGAAACGASVPWACRDAAHCSDTQPRHLQNAQ